MAKRVPFNNEIKDRPKVSELSYIKDRGKWMSAKVSANKTGY